MLMNHCGPSKVQEPRKNANLAPPRAQGSLRPTPENVTICYIRLSIVLELGQIFIQDKVLSWQESRPEACFPYLQGLSAHSQPLFGGRSPSTTERQRRKRRVSFGVTGGHLDSEASARSLVENKRGSGPEFFAAFAGSCSNTNSSCGNRTKGQRSTSSPAELAFAAARRTIL